MEKNSSMSVIILFNHYFYNFLYIPIMQKEIWLTNSS